MRLTIKTKLAAGFTAVLVLAGAAGGIGYQRLDLVGGTMTEILRVSKIADRSEAVAIESVNSASVVRAMVLNSDDTQIKALAEEVSRANSNVATGDQRTPRFDKIGIVQSFS